jgi:hypothetical protein
MILSDSSLSEESNLKHSRWENVDVYTFIAEIAAGGIR